VKATEGFSGAEIEESINSGMYAAFSEDRGLRDSDLVGAIQGTRPLSALAADRLKALRDWAANRTVAAD
jgi:hypothetical protein